jgi:light-regulated signal transduction histidine kinase (bacteriophytochrome)
VWPEAAGLPEVACGVLALPLAAAAGDYVMWFRPEYVRTVMWPGDPHKPVTVGPMGDRLTPRKSFELWVETVRGTSEPWTQLELDAARRLRTSMTELLVSENRELTRLNRELLRSNEDLDAFAYAASHDLEEPLRGIYNHAEFLKRDMGDVRTCRSIGFAGQLRRFSDAEAALVFLRAVDWASAGTIPRRGAGAHLARSELARHGRPRSSRDIEV